MGRRAKKRQSQRKSILNAMEETFAGRRGKLMARLWKNQLIRFFGANFKIPFRIGSSTHLKGKHLEKMRENSQSYGEPKNQRTVSIGPLKGTGPKVTLKDADPEHINDYVYAMDDKTVGTLQKAYDDFGKYVEDWQTTKSRREEQAARIKSKKELRILKKKTVEDIPSPNDVGAPFALGASEKDAERGSKETLKIRRGLN